MDLNQYLEKNILDTLVHLRENFEVVEYVKIEDDEFLKITEEGICFHAQNGDGIISGLRVYFINFDNYTAAKEKTVNPYTNLFTTSNAIKTLGDPIRTIRSIRIPTRPPTLPGLAFEVLAEKKIISVYHIPDKEEVAYIHIKLKED